MSDLNLPKLFNHELNSIYQSKPPVSRAKMASITKQALNAIKYYKHVVIAVEKFIAKCRPEYKLPGLYVIDSIVRQSQYQHGNKDVYGPRFSKNFQTTFENLLQCRDEDKPKIVRVLNLWQKNDIYTPDIIQPLMKLASQNRESFSGDSASGASSFNHSQLESSKKPSSQSFQSSSSESTASKGIVDLKGNSDAAMIIQQQQQKIEELMQQQQQLLQAQALQSLLGQNPVLAAAAAAVAVKDKADNSIVTLLQEQQNQLNQLETLKNQLSSQFEPPAPEPVPPKPYKESTTMSGHPTEFNKVMQWPPAIRNYMRKALLDDFDYSDEEEDMTQRIQRQRKQVEQQQTRLQDSSSAPDMDMLAQLQEQFRRNEHEHILTGGVGNTDAGRMHESAHASDSPGFHGMSSVPPPMMPMPPHHQPPPALPHHRLHEPPPPSHMPPRRSLSPEPFPPLPPHRRNQPPPPPHFEDAFPPPPQPLHDNMYPMPPPPSHRGGNGFLDSHHSPPPPRFTDEQFYHGDHRFPPRERRRSRSPVPPPRGRSRSPLPPPPRGRSRSPLPPPSRRSRSPLGRRSRSPPRGRSRSPHPPGGRSRSPHLPSGRSRRWDRDSRGRRSRSPRSRSPPPAPMKPQQQVRGYPHNTWEPTHPELEPHPPPPPPPKVEWRGKEIPTPKPKHYTVCSTTIWVGRLPKGITKLQLEEAFKEFGPIHSIEMVVQRGCAYVCMVFRADTVRARNGLMNTKIGGAYCKLAWAPGKGVKGPDYKTYWSLEDGASFIPWDLVKEKKLDELAVGGVIDPETYPPGVKPLPPPKPKEEIVTTLKDQDHAIAAPPTTSIAAQPTPQPPPMAPHMMPNIPPPPMPPMHMPPPPGAPANMMPPPPAAPFGATPPPGHMQGPPPPMGGPPPNMRPPFSQQGPPQQFSAPMVSPTFGGGHQMEMQFGGPQMNVQHMPLTSGHQMEMLRQPPPTSIPPPQINPNQFPSAVPSQNLPPSTPGEQQMEPQPKEQKSEEKESATKLVESSAGENDDSDKMDICDTWEQEKVQRLAEEVEKFEKEVMNIEKNSLKTSKDDRAAETGNNTTKAEERIADKMMETEENDGKGSVDEARKDDSRNSEVVREDKQDLTNTDVKRHEESKKELSKVESKNREAGEDEDKEKHMSVVPLTSGENPTPADRIGVAQENEQNKMEDNKLLSAKANEVALFDDAMDLQESSPEPVDQALQLTTDNA